MTSEQVIAEAETQCQLLGGLPIILEVGADLPVSPMPNVAFKCRHWVLVKARAGWPADSRIYPGILLSRSISGEEQRIEELIRWASYAEKAILNIPPEIRPNLQIVVSVAD